MHLLRLSSKWHIQQRARHASRPQQQAGAGWPAAAAARAAGGPWHRMAPLLAPSIRATHDVLAAEQLLGQHAGQAAQHVAAAVDHDGLQGRGAGASGSQ